MILLARQEEFWKRVKVSENCWLWLGERQSQKALPYGLFAYFDEEGKRRRIVAHRAAWLIHYRLPIPFDKELGHTCHESLCVRPSHLELVDHSFNVAISLLEGRRKSSS
jgi:hypothetical protein